MPLTETYSVTCGQCQASLSGGVTVVNAHSAVGSEVKHVLDMIVVMKLINKSVTL